MKKQIIILILIFLGIIMGVFLIQKPTIFKGRAEINISSGLKIQGENNEEVECQGQVCKTDAKNVTIEVTDPNVFLKD